MLKIESKTLEIAYTEAAQKLECSVTELQVEIVQHPSSGFLGLFAKSAIIVVLRKDIIEESAVPVVEKTVEPAVKVAEKKKTIEKEKVVEPAESSAKSQHRVLNDTILPTSFVTDQDDEDEQNDYIADAIEGMFDDEEDESDLLSPEPEDPVFFFPEPDFFAFLLVLITFTRSPRTSITFTTEPALMFSSAMAPTRNRPRVGVTIINCPSSPPLMAT